MNRNLPFLTAPDPPINGEGVLDPLGLGTIADHLADECLPGLRARMSRPRFLTAVAACAAVCEGLEEQQAADGVTPAYLVFEWLLVEAFIRTGDRGATRGTPGIAKAQTARDAGEVMCARAYLHIPSIFGFNGIYKPLARHLGIVDEDLRLNDNGYELLKVWQSEQGLEGFLESAVIDGPGRSLRRALREAVEEGLAKGYTKRHGGWQGWAAISRHLVPGSAGPREAQFLLQILRDEHAKPRGELFDLLAGAQVDDLAENEIAKGFLMPRASELLKPRLEAVSAYEGLCAVLEEAFDWIRYLSTRAQARPISAAEFASEVRPNELAAGLARAIDHTELCIAGTPLLVQQQFAELAKSFTGVKNAAAFFEAILEHHHGIQKAKKPDGKRDWFERSPDGATFVRIPYREGERPDGDRDWNRPYRIGTVTSFLADLQGAYARA